MSHLGDRVAPLIDGQLPMDASERAMTHMASCPHCQESADLERLTKQRLAGLGSPQPRTDFVQRLLALGVTEGPLPPAPGAHLAGGPGNSIFGSGAGSGFGPGTGFGAGSPLSPSTSPSMAAPVTVPLTGGAGPLSPSRPLSMPPSSSPGPGRGTPPAASRSPRGSSRPAARLSRSTRNRLVLAAASAACLVGVGVAGGVAAGPAIAKRQVSPPVDALHLQRPVPSGPLVGQTALVGASRTGR